MTINKYYLYLVILSLVIGPIYVPRLYYLFTYSRTLGKVTGYVEKEELVNNQTLVYKYPKVVFQTARGEFTTLATWEMNDGSTEYDYLPVCYDPDNPNKAFIKDYFGISGPEFIFVLPFFLIFTICIFHVDFIPRRFRITWSGIDHRLFD